MEAVLRELCRRAVPCGSVRQYLGPAITFLAGTSKLIALRTRCSVLRARIHQPARHVVPFPLGGPLLLVVCQAREGCSDSLRDLRKAKKQQCAIIARIIGLFAGGIQPLVGLHAEGRLTTGGIRPPLPARRLDSHTRILLYSFSSLQAISYVNSPPHIMPNYRRPYQLLLPITTIWLRLQPKPWPRPWRRPWLCPPRSRPRPWPVILTVHHKRF